MVVDWGPLAPGGGFPWYNSTMVNTALAEDNTIFVYYEMTERSSTRKIIQLDDIKDNQYESLYNMRWMKLLSHSLLTLGMSYL